MYSAKKIEDIKNQPGTWNSTKIGIFKDNEQVGSFDRNYYSFGESTFAPFKRGNDWYALYSPDYQSIRVMKLPECTPIEIVDEKSGFCPVEIYIPEFQWRLDKGVPPEELHKYPEVNRERISKDYEEKEYNPELFNKDMDGYHKFYDVQKEILYEDFAFVSGCFWGDDSSWKIELYDISKANLGIIKKVPEWGYYELPGLSLKECIHLSSFRRLAGTQQLAPVNATITITKTIRLNFEEDIKLEFFDE